MATSDKDCSALPGALPDGCGPALARAGASALGEARHALDATDPTPHSGGADGPTQSRREINLILADSGRVRVTRKIQEPGSPKDHRPAPAAASSPLPTPAVRSRDEASFRSLQLTDVRQLDPAASGGTAGDLPAPQETGLRQTRAEKRSGRITISREETGEAPEPQADESALVAIPVHIDQLHSSRLRSRAPYDETVIEALAASIRTRGWQQPILVRPHPLIARDYEIVVGELPFQAARFAGLECLPVVVCGLSDYRALECVLLEDVQRPDLAPLEVAVGYGQLIRTFHYSLADLAKLAGRSERQVARLLLMLDPPEVPHPGPGAAEGKSGDPRPARPACEAADVSAMSGAGDPAPPETVMDHHPEAAANGRPRRAAPSLNAELAALERHLSGVLGLKVEMTTRGWQGAVQISFADLEQLEWIARHLSSLGVRPEAGPKYPGLAA